MWDEIQIQCSDAFEIAEALYNNEITISQLNAVAAFAPKAPLVEEAVWNYCKKKKNAQRYLAIYANGKYRNEVEELVWAEAKNANTIKGFMDYVSTYPEGRHIDDVDDCVWAIVLGQKTFEAMENYMDLFPEGKHASEVDDYLWEIAEATNNYSGYLEKFPQGIHAGEAFGYQQIKAAEEGKWQEACRQDTVAAYESYKQTYANGSHIQEAEERINALKVGQKKSIINDLIEDRNAYSLAYIKQCGITQEDLKGQINDNQGNPCDVIFKSWNKPVKNLTMGRTPSSIPSGSTEVYFWGVPGSGKTCAMAAILSQARKMGCFEPREGEGLAYMNALSTMFLPEPTKPAVCLPTASDVDSTQYLPLTLNERVEGRKGREIIMQHNLSVIEISGEIFECFSCEVEGKPFKSAEHKKTYEQLKEYLNSDENPKYHFFILDCKPLRDADQMTYLQNAALYFRNRGVFNGTTQGISLIVTKCDVLSPDRSQWVKCAENVAKDYFGALVTQLKRIVGDPSQGGLGLSDGSLKVIPLSIGDVYFQSLCMFDPVPATTLVNLLMEYSKTVEDDNWRKRAKKLMQK